MLTCKRLTKAPIRSQINNSGGASPGTIIKKIFLLTLLVIAGISSIQAQRIYALAWADANSDGRWQLGEISHVGVQVQVYTCSGATPIATKVTDGGGEAWFEPTDGIVAGGSYRLKFSIPTGKFPTYMDVGGDDVTDSDINKQGWTNCFPVTAVDTSELFGGFVDCPPAGALPCSDVNFSLAKYPSCTGLLTPEYVLSGKVQCSNSFEVTVTTQAGAAVPNPITANYIGQTLMASVRDPQSGNFCWANVYIEYKLAPTITNCNSDTLRCFDGTPAATNLTYRPTIVSCNPSAYLTFKDVERDIPCAGDPLSGRFKRVVERTWTARDTNGFRGTVMTATCVQRFYFRGSTFADVAVPSSLRLTCNTSFTPDANGNPTPVTGSVFTGPTIGGMGLWNSTTHPCMFNAVYTDQVVPMCKGSKKIIRNWKVIDWCTTEFREYIQFIELIDNVAPTMTCPANLTISTDNSSCYASLTPPTPTVSDQCSGEWTLSLSASSGRVLVGTVVADLRVGTHTITWTAQDPCENTKSCSFQVTVRDQVNPVPVCVRYTTVTLDKVNGDAFIYASSFDNGSHDNCGIKSIKVRRTNGCIGSSAFADSVRVVCCDAAAGFMVELMVTDSSNNTNSCMAEVSVNDKQGPTIVCPRNLTIDCDDNRTPSQFGKVVTLGQKRDTFFINGQQVIDGVGYDNCNQVFISNVDSSIRDCGRGTIWRTFTIKDINNLTSSCTQYIEIYDVNPYVASDISWPSNYTTTNCSAGISPDSLPAPYNKPRILSTKCGRILVSDPEDIVFPIAAPACFKVYRKWRVVDWCQYNPNVSGSKGLWEYTQEIVVMDNQKPNFVNPPSSFSVDITTDPCRGSFTVPTATVTDCRPNINISVSVKNSTGTTVGSGYGPHSVNAGTYTVTYTAEDGCGNVSTHVITVVVRDKKKPTPIAYKGLAIDLMPATGQVSIAADRFNNWSFDNCTANADLILRLGRLGTPNQTVPPSSSSLTFSCADLGTQKVDLWVGDASGNWDYVTTTIEIQNNMGANCGPTSTANVTGTIATEESKAFEGVTVGTNLINPAAAVTNNLGAYSLNKIQTGKNVTVTPAYDQNPLNGVTTADLVLINRHILGTQTLTSPYKLIAANAYNDNRISTLDLVELRKLILQQSKSFTNNKPWRFIEGNYKFTTSNPLDEKFLEVCDIATLDKDMIANFVAVKVGDVNGDAKVSSLQEMSERSKNTLTVVSDDQTLIAGQLYKVYFRVEDNTKEAISGYQFTMNFDKSKLEYQDILKADAQDLSSANFGLSQLAEGAILVSWNSNTPVNHGEKIFGLVFKAKSNAQLSDVLSLGSRYITSEAISMGNQIMNVNLQFNNGSVVTNKFDLYQNQPNPYKGATTIGFSLPQAGYAKLTLVDAAGRTLKVVEGEFTKGYNEVLINSETIQTTGVIYYRLDTAFGSASKKMVVLE